MLGLSRVTVLNAESMFYSGSLDVLYSPHHSSILLWHQPPCSARLAATPRVSGILHLQSTVSLSDLCDVVGGSLLLKLSVVGIALADSWDVVSVPGRTIRRILPPLTPNCTHQKRYPKDPPSPAQLVSQVAPPYSIALPQPDFGHLAAFRGLLSTTR